MDTNDPNAPARRVYCNRTLNLRGIRAVGYDMDYTLVHYRVVEWEERAYRHMQNRLASRGWPVSDLRFDPERVIRGLVLDVELGNLVTPNRFGYVGRAHHGTRPLSFDEQRGIYARELVDLDEDRFVFLNTLFSISEGCLYAQLVDLLDEGRIPDEAVGYRELYRNVRESMSEAHLEGEVKAEIAGDPERFVEPDPALPETLLDQRDAGKKLLLVTNSEWAYTKRMMEFAFDRFLPGDTKWGDLFHLVIVAARKPWFFTADSPVFRVIPETGLLEPMVKGFDGDGVYLGGSARQVEQYLGLSGDEILYVGDHMFTDVHVSKSVLRWRTALVLRELESDLCGIAEFEETGRELAALMERKEALERDLSRARLELLRTRRRRAPTESLGKTLREIEGRVRDLRAKVVALDGEIAPLASAATRLGNPHWGPLMRAGNDKSHLARQIERSADLYTSRVSNFRDATPYAYFRAPRGSLPHDPL